MKKLFLYCLLSAWSIQTTSNPPTIKNQAPNQQPIARLSLQETGQLINLALHCMQEPQHRYMIIGNNGHTKIRVDMMQTAIYQQEKEYNQQIEQTNLQQIEQRVEQKFRKKLKVAQNEKQLLQIYSGFLLITTTLASLYACYAHYLARA